MDYKSTLNLPTTAFPMRANSAVREPEIQAFWERERIYERILERRAGRPTFILHDGPPYSSSGRIHIGHALNKILKDMVVKHRALSGYYAPFVPGYDTHGLPTEIAALKELKDQKKDLQPLEIRKLCQEFAMRSVESQQRAFPRLGIFGDWHHPYITLQPEFEATQVRVFGQMAAKGHIYKGLKPVYWCTTCVTALAEAEVEYEDHVSPSIYVRFAALESPAAPIAERIASGERVDFLIWTTTPWTLPANLAIAVHPEIEYTLLEQGGAWIVVAVDRADAVIAAAGAPGVRKTDIRILGRELEHSTYRHPFLDRQSPVILGSHVTLETGSGLVHTAPGHGNDDYVVGQAYGLPILAPVDDRGVFTAEAGELVAGQYYAKANPVVLAHLGQLGALWASDSLTHSYPHCWRCHKPIIFRATEQWFASIASFRDQALAAIRQVRWQPAYGELRIANMVEGRTDWCISRQRTWGVPIPVFFCQACNAPLLTPASIEAVAEVFAREGSDAWWQREPAELLPTAARCASCGCQEFRKETDIMDVWFDSGVTHEAVCAARGLGWPVDLYLEGSDQYRGWFQSSLLTAVATRGAAPYRMVIKHGFALDPQGRKMSKSLGNVVEPDQVVAKYGADVLRLWVSSVDYSEDVKIGDVILQQL
ncbi:MAG: isoleucine--tRNA ligase, partial [Cyanobacteria bacterium REEB65]|nr:isoleucine--tRNA ligase [Cyanobacteria bacterium REEB65]